MKVYADPQTTGYTVKKLPFYLRRSFYVHLALFSITLIGGKVISIQQEKLRERNLELIQASVRVDMVAMPKYTLNELKNLSSGVEEAKKEEAAVTEAKKEEVKPEPVEEKKEEPKQDAGEADNTEALEVASKKKKLDFLSKLKELGNKKIKGEGNVKAEKGLYGEKSTDLKQLVLSGNKLSKGVAITGSGSAAEMTAFQVYAAKLPQMIRPNWRLPDFLLKDKSLKCRVQVWLSPNGEVTRASIYQSSGNPDYDSRAIEAVKSSSPFPRLPEELSERGRNGNIILGFPI